MTQTSKTRSSRFFGISSQSLKSLVYLLAITVVMLIALLSRDDSLARDTESIVSYLSNYTQIPNSVTSVILVTRLFDTVGEVSVFTIAGLGVKILLYQENSEERFVGINDEAVRLLLDLAALLSFFLAIDLALKGHLTPGGGFASGVAGATAITLLMITGRLQKVENFYFKANAPAMEKFAVACFILFSLATLSSFLYPSSIFSELPPAFYIPILNVIAALKVTLGAWSILRLFVIKRGVL